MRIKQIYKQYLWPNARLSRHPKRSYGLFNTLFTLNVWQLILAHTIIIIFVSLIFSVAYEYYYTSPNGNEMINHQFSDYFYNALIQHIAFAGGNILPHEGISRWLKLSQGYFGLIQNVLFLSLIFARALHPHNVFEITPFLLHSPKKGSLTIRLYSKYPEPVHDIVFRFDRFMITENAEGQNVGRRESIKIYPKYRRLLYPFYPQVIKIPIMEKTREWSEKLEDVDAQEWPGIPVNWFQMSNSQEHLYLTVSGQTTAGVAFQIQTFYFTSDNLRCGEHRVFLPEESEFGSNWYDYTKYTWKNWAAYDPPKCEDCKVPKCLHQHSAEDMYRLDR